ncbi:microcystin degradation protein MlrC [Mycoplana sp. BE70]|uniref:M81 family metallopeptidase n=1 Tax=Mycoplana sp. BE70 TaxID=2817775 RepID=UPI00285D7F24|nr:M81 family metallopeptidase [Mycoplana sp. BE70]MDR6759262.1 microcystin degradation protein MlrC [Mycoplana sp. BE70]
MSGKLRIAVARLWHEAHSFTPVQTRLADFRRKEWQQGPATADFYRGTNTEIGAVVELIDSDGDLDVHFSLCTAAPPGGLVPQGEMDQIHEAILEGLENGPWDGIYLSLHGATLSTGSLSPDADLINRIRTLAGPDIPIAVSFDMHACINPQLADLVQILSGYHTYPHVDMKETGHRAMAMLLDCLRNKRPVRLHLRHVPMLPLSHMMRTASGPMRELVDLGREAMRKPGILDATFFASFTYADSPHASAVVAVTADDEADTETLLDSLASAFLERAPRFNAPVIRAHEGLTRAEALLENGSGRGPVALIDTADNPLSGGIGDTTGLLRAWLEQSSHLRTVFSFFHDPALVAKCHRLGEGARISVDLGGRIMPEHGAPVPLTVRVLRLTDGRFHNVGPMENGMAVDIGRTALLEAGNLRLVVSETCQSVNDPAWCDLHGIELAGVDLFLVKAKNHFRAAFEPFCRALIDIESPGPSPADLHLVPYRHVPRSLLD